MMSILKQEQADKETRNEAYKRTQQKEFEYFRERLEFFSKEFYTLKNI